MTIEGFDVQISKKTGDLKLYSGLEAESYHQSTALLIFESKKSTAVFF